jgi:hypothetical protein
MGRIPQVAPTGSRGRSDQYPHEHWKSIETTTNSRASKNHEYWLSICVEVTLEADASLKFRSSLR